MKQWEQNRINPSGYKYKGEDTNPFFGYDEDSEPGGGLGEGLEYMTFSNDESGFTGYEITPGPNTYGTYTLEGTFVLYYDYNGQTQSVNIKASASFSIESSTIDFDMTKDALASNIIACPLNSGDVVYYGVPLTVFCRFLYSRNRFTLEVNTQTVPKIKGFENIKFVMTRVKVEKG